MTIRFDGVPLDEIRADVRAHLESLPSPIDGFLEGHIRESTHFRISISGAPAGFASIHNERLVTQFALRPGFRRTGQEAFARLRRMESVTSAFVPTCDELYLSHVLDSYRELRMQAYFFAVTSGQEAPEPAGFTLQRAGAGDAAAVEAETGDFFDPLQARIERGEVYLVRRSDEIVGFGIMERSELSNAASIGMFTSMRVRGQGVGTATIQLLIAECRRPGLTPAAGCWYYNHASKKTLERAGMYTATRLLRVEF